MSRRHFIGCNFVSINGGRCDSLLFPLGVVGAGLYCGLFLNLLFPPRLRAIPCSHAPPFAIRLSESMEQYAALAAGVRRAKTKSSGTLR